MLDIRSTGTPAGMSSTLVVAECERKFALNATRPIDLLPKLPPEGEKPNALLVGSGMHGGLAEWYKGAITDIAQVEEGIQWYGQSIEDSHPTSCAEIRRILRWYYRTHTPAEFGRVLHVEIEIALPRSDEELPGFTGAIDLIVELSEDDVIRLGAEGLYLPGPGVYGVDHKSATSDSKSAQMEYALRPQFAGYHLISPVSLRGFIANRVIKTKELKRKLYYIPPPDEHGKMMVQSLIQDRLRVLQSPPDRAKPNPDVCLDRYGNLCPWLHNGCERY